MSEPPNDHLNDLIQAAVQYVMVDIDKDDAADQKLVLQRVDLSALSQGLSQECVDGSGEDALHAVVQHCVVHVRV